MKTLLIVIAALSLTGCASALAKHEMLSASINSPIDCHQADMAITNLNHEKANSRERFVNGVASILPTSVVFNLLVGEYSSRAAIATGKFNQQINSRISDIQTICQLDTTLASL